MSTGRRDFLKTVALSGAAGTSGAAEIPAPAAKPAAPPAPSVEYPRVFTGRRLAMLAFPLGGVAAGSISLGGRGQLRDWEIFNRPDKGNSPTYAFPSIWVQTAGGKPDARVLESRLLPPYEGSSGLGTKNAPGLRRLDGATFTGEFPLARIAFRDRKLPVKVSLEAFSPFIPHDPEDSGLPVAVLRYIVVNPGPKAASVAIGFSLENPVGPPARGKPDTRENAYSTAPGLAGIVMTNPALPQNDPLAGSLALAVLDDGKGKITYLRGWPRARWWTSPLLFWDDFTSDGELGPEAEARGPVAALSVKREIPAGEKAAWTFLLAWSFPNRTPERCGWRAPRGDENTVIGNHYCRRFPKAWDAATYAASHLPDLEKRTRAFVDAMRATTLPAAVKDAASANLSTLVTQVCFRTADGEFHGFEGANDKAGCCHGNCTHVWNYETTTHFLFPTFARSLRRASFGYSLDEEGGMHFRQALPDGKVRGGLVAADGQMGQIMKAYIDWRISGDDAFLREFWPRVKKAIEFAWIPNGWDADRDGVLEGVQHNTYDVEFYGPNPECGVYYLGALRAAEEMARAAGDTTSASAYRGLFERGRKWIDDNLFNGEYYIQKVRGVSAGQIPKSLRSAMGSDNTETPEYQVGDGCLVDQLVGQYQAEAAGLGPLLDEAHIRKTLASIYRYNFKRNLMEHDSVQRIFALNDEAALIVCDYGRGRRPRVPFPYYAELFTGMEYTAAAHMIWAGMVKEGVECFRAVRARYDGERRNPWDEAECGHHYARAMAAWSGMLALSGFRYDGVERRVSAAPRIHRENFTSFWASGTGWGTFSLKPERFSLAVTAGRLPVRCVQVAVKAASAAVGGRAIAFTAVRGGIELKEEVTLLPGEVLSVHA